MMTRGYAFAQTDGDRERRIRQYMSLVHGRRRSCAGSVDGRFAGPQQVGVIGLIDATTVRVEPLRAFRGLCRVPHQGCDFGSPAPGGSPQPASSRADQRTA